MTKKSVLFSVLSFFLLFPYKSFAENSTYYVKSGALYQKNLDTGSVKLLSRSPERTFKEGASYIREWNGTTPMYYEVTSEAKIFTSSFELPYTRMNLRQNSGLTRDTLNQMILSSSPSSPLVPWTSAYIEAETKYGVNALYLLSHSIEESGWGFSARASSQHNLFGMGSREFVNFGDSILYAGSYINRYYLTPGAPYFNGGSLRGMNVVYATNPLWADNIGSIMERLKPYVHYGEFYKNKDGVTFLMTMTGPVKATLSVPSFEPETYATVRGKTVYATNDLQMLGSISSSDESFFPSAVNDPNPFYITTASAVVYKTPSEGESITTIPVNRIFSYRSKNGAFYQVKLQDGRDGWINENTVKLF